MKEILIPLLLPAVLLGAGAAGSLAESPPAWELTTLAGTFTREFLAGKHEAGAKLMNDTMRSAASPVQWEQLRQGLILQNGPVVEIGEPWIEDTVQGLLRIRVPVGFERAALDFRVVLDGSNEVTGFFIEPHVEPPDAGMELEVQLGADDATIPGTLTLPVGGGPFPAVVLIHGSGPNDRDETVGPNKPFRDLAWGLAEHGVATLRYDKRSHSRPADLLALGDGLTVREEVIDDARLAFDLLREREDIDPSRIYFVGHSLGGSLLPRIAAIEPQPAGLISLAGATDLRPEKIVEQTRYIVSNDGEITDAERAHLEAIEHAVATVRASLDGNEPDPPGYIMGAPIAYFRDLLRHEPATQAAALGLPILVLQGTRDYQVTLEDFEGWKQALANKPFACCVTYEGLDHLFRMGEGASTPDDYLRSAPFASRVIDDIANWIAERTCPTGN